MFRFAAVITLFFLSSATFSQTDTDQLTDNAKKNLILCIEHENDGVRAAGVQFVGKYQLEEAIPLLCKILKEDPNPRVRKLAAYSLFRMNENKGLFAIKEALDCNDCKEVRLFCSTMFEISERE